MSEAIFTRREERFSLPGTLPSSSSPLPPPPPPPPTRLYSVYVAAADGTQLALDCLVPQHAAGSKFPTVLMMTRYWRGTLGGSLNPWQDFYSQHGFAVVCGDVRGTGASFGQWPYHRHRAEREDLAAIIDWVIVQPWSDRRVIGAGTSYLANTADWMAASKHPALKAITPRYADFDPYTDLYFPGGVPNRFMGQKWGTRVKDLDQNKRVLLDGTLSRGVRPVDGVDGMRQLEAALKEHSSTPSVWTGLQEITYRDDRPSTWNGESITDVGICSPDSGLKDAGVPMQNWGSWMDSGTANGSINRFLLVPDSIHVIIGPWSHKGSHTFDPLRLHESAIPPAYHEQQLEDLSFINDVLEGNERVKGKLLSYYTCGERRWKTTSVWPPANAYDGEWYLAPDSSLARKRTGAGVDVYEVDFGVGTGATSRWVTNQDGTPVHYEDRSDMDKRMLCYTSTPLERDMEVTGHPILTLFLSSTESDCAIFAYLEAVAPDGKVAYLTEGQLRAIHRRISSHAQPYPVIGPHHTYLKEDAAPLTPGEVAEIKFSLHPISVRVPAGYCLRVAIAGADKDVFARIPAVGDPVFHVHRGLRMESRITLPIVDI